MALYIYHIRKKTLLVAFLFLCLADPFYLWNIPGRQIVKVVIELIVPLLFIKEYKLDKSFRNYLYLYLFIWVLYIVIMYIHGARLGLLVQIPYLLFCFGFFLNRVFARNVLIYFSTIYTIIMILSMISYILSYWDLSPVIGTISHPDEMLSGKGVYYVYHFCVRQEKALEHFRFSGIFDEPGVVGTIGALLLCDMRFNFKDWRVFPIFLSGLLSLSFFFIIIVFGYLAFNYIILKKKIVFGLLLGVLLSFIYFSTKEDPILYSQVWSRFEWDSDRGKFSGDNRMGWSGDGEWYFNNKVKGTSQYYWGVDDKELYWDYAFGSSSINNVIAMNGAVFTFAYIFFFLAYGFHFKENYGQYALFCFVLLGCLYQRSNIYHELYMFLFAYLARLPDYLKNETPLLKTIEKTSY